jgi:hypothetical protein
LLLADGVAPSGFAASLAPPVADDASDAAASPAPSDGDEASAVAASVGASIAGAGFDDFVAPFRIQVSTRRMSDSGRGRSGGMRGALRARSMLTSRDS